MSGTLICPKCGFSQEPSLTCGRCGVIFAKLHSAPSREGPVPKTSVAPFPPSSRRRVVLITAGLVTALAIALVGYFVSVLQPQEEERIETAFINYRKALSAGDPKAIAKTVVSSKRSELEAPGAGEVIKLMAGLMPETPKVRRLEIKGESATLELVGHWQGREVKGQAKMSHEGTVWLVAEEKWSFDLGQLEANQPIGMGISSWRGPDKLRGGEDTNAFEPVITELLRTNPESRGAAAFRADSRQPPRVVRTLTGHREAVGSFAFSEDGDRLLSAGFSDLTLRLWQVSTGLTLANTPTEWRVTDAAITPLGNAAITLDVYRHLLLWPIGVTSTSIGPAQEIGMTAEYETHTMALSPNGRLIATGGGLPTVGGTLSLWDLRKASQIGQLVFPMLIRDLAFSPNGRFLAAGTSEASFIIFDLRDGEARRYRVRGPSGGTETVSVAWSPEGELLATAHNDSSMSVWNMVEGKQISDFYVRDASALAIAYSRDGQVLASAQVGGAVYLWAREGEKRLAAYKPGLGDPAALAFEPSGRWLAVSWGNGSITLLE